jgi:hypothetical protein
VDFYVSAVVLVTFIWAKPMQGYNSLYKTPLRIVSSKLIIIPAFAVCTMYPRKFWQAAGMRQLKAGVANRMGTLIA